MYLIVFLLPAPLLRADGEPAPTHPVAAAEPLVSDTTAASGTRAILRPGQTAPVDTLFDLTGQAVTFPEPGVWNLVFYWSLFCQSCLEEIPQLVEGLASMENLSCRQFYVSIDTDRMKKGITNYLRRRNFDCPVLLEEIASSAFRTADRWGVGITPATFLIDPHGTVVFAREGPFDLEELYHFLRAAQAPGPATPPTALATATAEPRQP